MDGSIPLQFVKDNVWSTFTQVPTRFVRSVQQRSNSFSKRFGNRRTHPKNFCGTQKSKLKTCKSALPDHNDLTIHAVTIGSRLEMQQRATIRWLLTGFVEHLRTVSKLDKRYCNILPMIVRHSFVWRHRRDPTTKNIWSGDNIFTLRNTVGLTPNFGLNFMNHRAAVLTSNLSLQEFTRQHRTRSAIHTSFSGNAMRRRKKLIPEDPKAIGKSAKKKRHRKKKPSKKHDQHGGHQGHGSVRTASHNGFEIEIETSYEFRVNGKPLPIHAHVLDNGYIHSPALPNYGWQSAVDFVRQLIDSFPEDFAAYEKRKRKKKSKRKSSRKKSSKSKKKPAKRKAAKKKKNATKKKTGTKKKAVSKTKKSKSSRRKKSKSKTAKKRKAGKRQRKK